MLSFILVQFFLLLLILQYTLLLSSPCADLEIFSRGGGGFDGYLSVPGEGGPRHFFGNFIMYLNTLEFCWVSTPPPTEPRSVDPRMMTIFPRTWISKGGLDPLSLPSTTGIICFPVTLHKYMYCKRSKTNKQTGCTKRSKSRISLKFWQLN